MKDANMVLYVAGTILVLVPAIAWRAWWRLPRPRPWTLLAVAVATTAPAATGLSYWIALSRMVQSWREDETGAPGERARRLGESISEAMNRTAFAVVGAAVVAGGLIVIPRVLRRARSR